MNGYLIAAQIARDFATAADAEFLAWKSRAEQGADNLSMSGACALGMAHQARRIAEAIDARAALASAGESVTDAKLLREDADTFAAAMLVASVHNEKEIVAGDDGLYVYWPERPFGAFSAWVLRAIADELDRLNAPVHEHLASASTNKVTEGERGK